MGRKPVSFHCPLEAVMLRSYVILGGAVSLDLPVMIPLHAGHSQLLVLETSGNHGLDKLALAFWSHQLLFQ